VGRWWPGGVETLRSNAFIDLITTIVFATALIAGFFGRRLR
jgi:hypothetical protein